LGIETIITKVQRELELSRIMKSDNFCQQGTYELVKELIYKDYEKIMKSQVTSQSPQKEINEKNK